jgi:hypothetical protein
MFVTLFILAVAVVLVFAGCQATRAGYRSKQKIAMTTPVFMSGSDSNATMALVMPAKLKSGEVPKPGGWLGGGAGIGGGAVRRAALQRRSQCEARGGGAGPVENVDGGGRIEGILAAGVWLF